MFSGDRFYWIDDTATREEAPADTVFTHYLVNNARFIERGYDRAGAGMLMRSGDPESAVAVRTGRIYANVNEMSLRCVPMYFDRIPRRVVVDLYLPFGAPPTQIAAQLDLEEASARSSLSASANRARRRLVLEISGLTRQQSGFLWITMQSIDVTRIPAQSSLSAAFAENETVVNLEAGNDIYEDDVAEFPFWAGAQATGRDSIFSYSAADHVVVNDPNRISVTGLSAVQALGGDTAVYNISTLQVASYHISVDYDDDYFDGPELRANIPEFSDVNRRIVAIQSRQYERPVLLSTGTQGDYRIGEGWPEAHRQEWRFVDGDATSSVELMRQSHDYVEGLDSIEVYPGLMGIHMIDPPFEDRAGFRFSDRLWEQRSTARWSLTLSVEQYIDADETVVVSSTTREVAIPHLPCSNLIESPALHQAYWQKFFEEFDEYYYTYTEGQLQPEDLAWITDQVLQVQVGEIDPRFPFDVVLSAARSADYEPIYGSVPFRGWGGSDKLPLDEFEEPEFLRLQLMYFSVYARRG